MKTIKTEAERLSRRHRRSYSLILFRGDAVLAETGDQAKAIRAMREYCHSKAGATIKVVH